MPRPTARMLRPIAALLLAGSLAACSLVAPPESGGTLPATTVEQRAARLEKSGDAAGAARLWEEAARAGAPERRNAAWLSAARSWLLAGDAAGMERALASLVAPVAAADAAEKTRLTAEVALLRGQPDRALTALRTLAEPLNAAALGTRARVYAAAGQWTEVVRTRVARQALLGSGEALRTDQRSLLTELTAAASKGANLKPPKGADATTAGWLELGVAAAQAQRNPFAAGAQFNQWRARYPQHPAAGELLNSVMQDSSARLDYPAQVALLLPLSGRSATAGTALRDGFLAGYYQQMGSERPRVKIYDVATTDAASAYLQAVADGANFVVGPLTKEEVTAVAQIADDRATVLALNFLNEGTLTPSRFYQFSLAPEDEAREVARRVVLDGRPRGVALVPSGDWGRRVLAAFSEELSARGGTLVAQRLYSAGTTDFKDLILDLVGDRRAEQRRQQLEAAAGRPLEGAARGRNDVDFIFMPGQPTQGRLIRPQLKFHYAGDLPAYATSDIYAPSTSANTDLDGVMFPDMPWMIAADPGVAGVRDQVQRLWPDRAAGRGRLYAMGFDAYRLVAELRSPRAFRQAVIGMTGRLALDGDRRVRRDLDWAQVRSGQPQLLPFPGATAAR